MSKSPKAASGRAGPAGFAGLFAVSRETMERLTTYHDLLVKWQRVQNLVAPNTLVDVWGRHFADSAQLFAHIGGGGGDSKTVIDMGSGGGFPGMVIAILAAERGGVEVHLVESNGRKCAFLKDVARQAGVDVEIHNCRIEVFAVERSMMPVDYVTARALKPLATLLSLGQVAFDNGAVGLFLKGKQAELELEEARKGWDFDVELIASRTDPEGRIVKLSDVKQRS